jgi:hypothetical protein
MGQDWRPDEAVSLQLIQVLFRSLVKKMVNATTASALSQWTTARGLMAFLYVFSLRGNEGLLAELKGLREEFNAGRAHDPTYSTLALLGQFKGEQHRRQHLMYSVDETDSGIQVRKIISDLIALRHSEGRVDGPAICDPEGRQWATAQAKEILHELLYSIFDQDPVPFPSHVPSHADIKSKYHLYRSFRRASDSRAIAKGINLSDIRVVHHWSKVEKAKGQRPTFEMSQHYAQIDLLVYYFLRYTGAM